MFKYIGIFLLTLLLVSCAGKPKFDVRTQTVAYKDLTVVQAPKGCLLYTSDAADE